MILCLGAAGKLGLSLVQQLRKRGHEVLAPSRTELDVEQVVARPHLLSEWLGTRTLQAIVNCAAYNLVDRAESETEICARMNAGLPGVLAEFAESRGIVLVHFSSDYVFSGDGNWFQKESDTVGPLSVYGQTKADGEVRVLKACPRALIFRVSWLYTQTHPCFSELMLRLIASGEPIRVVNDQIGAPSYTPVIAELVTTAVSKVLGDPQFKQWGLYHLATREVVSREGFVRELQRIWHSKHSGATLSTIQGVPTSAIPQPAQRPLNSRFDLSRFITVFLDGDAERIPTWQESARRYLESRP